MILCCAVKSLLNLWNHSCANLPVATCSSVLKQANGDGIGVGMQTCAWWSIVGVRVHGERLRRGVVSLSDKWHGPRLLPNQKGKGKGGKGEGAC